MTPYAACSRTALAWLLATGLAHAQITPETVEAIMKRHENSVLFLSGTVQYLCGQCTRDHSLRVMSSVVVADAKGLMLAGVTGPLADPEVEIRGVTLQVRMPDGTDVPVRVALTDQDLGVMILALEKPEDAKRHVLQPLAFDTPALARMLDPLLVLRRHDQATGYAMSTASIRVHAMETRPRRLYFSAGLGPDHALSPCFDSTGRLVAIALGDRSAVSADELVDLIAQAQTPIAE